MVLMHGFDVLYTYDYVCIYDYIYINTDSIYVYYI